MHTGYHRSCLWWKLSLSCAMHKLCLRRTPARPFSLPCQLSSLWQQPQDPQPWSLLPSRPLPAGSMLMGALLRPLSLLLTSMCPSSGTVIVPCCTFPAAAWQPCLSCPVRRSDCCIVWHCVCPYTIHMQYIMYSIIRSIGCYAVHTLLFPVSQHNIHTHQYSTVPTCQNAAFKRFYQISNF